ncbi:hypothetical protein DFH11DRAFT_1544845 [Phellopilus nigrolimitatus]|nr:hypothetical protein DFH11DRAFT_1544845 [Phellopilus nigrolimitatus]
MVLPTSPSPGAPQDNSNKGKKCSLPTLPRLFTSEVDDFYLAHVASDRLVESEEQLAASPSSSTVLNEIPLKRVRSLHGVIEHSAPPSPVEPQEGISHTEALAFMNYASSSSMDESRDTPRKAPQVLTADELAKELDREEDIGTQDEALRSAEWYEERGAAVVSPSQEQFPQNQLQERTYSPRQSSLRTTSYFEQPHVQAPARSGSLSPMHSLPGSPSASPTAASGRVQFPERQRFTLVDSGPISPSLSGGTGISGRRAVSDSGHGSPSDGLTPPLRRPHRGGASAPPSPSGTGSQPTTPRYATFEEMGIRGRGMAEAQAEKKDAKDCIIM